MLGKGRVSTTNLSFPAGFTVHHYNGPVISQGPSRDAGRAAQSAITFSWFVAHPPRRQSFYSHLRARHGHRVGARQRCRTHAHRSGRRFVQAPGQVVETGTRFVTESSRDPGRRHWLFGSRAVPLLHSQALLGGKGGELVGCCSGDFASSARYESSGSRTGRSKIRSTSG